MTRISRIRPEPTLQFAALLICGVFAAQDLVAQTIAPTNGKTMQGEYLNTVQELSLAAAQQLVANGVAAAGARDMRLAISVVDRAGNLLAFARMDGASIVTVDVAIGKARTAAYIRNPSKAFEDMINSGMPSMATTPGLLPLQGGMPVIFEGQVVGAVGVSGSSGENDQTMAALISKSFGAL